MATFKRISSNALRGIMNHVNTLWTSLFTTQSKETPVAADEILIKDSADGGTFKKTSLTSIINASTSDTLWEDDGTTIIPYILTRDLAIGTNTLVVDTANEKVGIGTTTPEANLDIKGSMLITQDNPARTIWSISEIGGGNILGTKYNSTITSGVNLISRKAGGTEEAPEYLLDEATTGSWNVRTWDEAGNNFTSNVAKFEFSADGNHSANNFPVKFHIELVPAGGINLVPVFIVENNGDATIVGNLDVTESITTGNSIKFGDEDTYITESSDDVLDTYIEDKIHSKEEDKKTTLYHTDDSSLGFNIDVIHERTTGETANDGDSILGLSGYFYNDAGTPELIQAARMSFTASQTLDGWEKGNINFAAMNSGSFDNHLTIGGGIVTFYSTILPNPDDSKNLGHTIVRWQNLYLSNYIDISEMTAPSNPPANTGRLYVADNAGTTSLYFKDSTGAVTQIV